MKKLNSTYEIKRGTQVRLYLKGFGYSLGEIIESNDYYVSIKTTKEIVNRSLIGDEIDLYVWIGNDKSFECTISVVSKIQGPDYILFLNHSKEIFSYKGPRCLEAVVDVPVTFFTFDPLHEKKGLSAKSVNSQQGTILLLGDREAVIKSPVELINDSFIKGSFVIHETEIELTGLVLDLNSEKNIYNIIFSGMEKQKEKILHYIYQFYRE